jgi:hypothetical protein
MYWWYLLTLWSVGNELASNDQIVEAIMVN